MDMWMKIRRGMVLAVMSALILPAGQAAAQEKKETQKAPAAAVQKGGKAKQAADPKASDAPKPAPVVKLKELPKPAPELYAEIPQQLSPTECGKCHRTQYMNIKETGGRHQFDCQGCHQVIHAYNPLRNNYLEIMPKCAMCHELPHGDKQVECLKCHNNPHAVAKAPEISRVKGVCADCHADPAQQLKTYPSRHSKVECSSCHHSTHGYIPNCSECHQPHYPEEPFTECMNCHKPHQPVNNINFTDKTNPQICNACHDSIVSEWKGTKSKHGQVNCGMCHTKHGLIPQCTTCHPQPHPEAQLKLFPKCLDCHINVHDLPVKRK